jgi:hypothetical protein
MAALSAVVTLVVTGWRRTAFADGLRGAAARASLTSGRRGATACVSAAFVACAARREGFRRATLVVCDAHRVKFCVQATLEVVEPTLKGLVLVVEAILKGCFKLTEVVF